MAVPGGRAPGQQGHRESPELDSWRVRPSRNLFFICKLKMEDPLCNITLGWKHDPG